jgi:hypothetical protein
VDTVNTTPEQVSGPCQIGSSLQRFLVLGALALCASTGAHAQQMVAAAALPDAPDAGALTATAPDADADPSHNGTQPHQTKRILGIVPNFRAVSADTKLPPQTVKQKFTVTMQQTFDYSAWIFAGLQAGIAQADDQYPEFGDGGKAYFRYYWHTMADESNENIWVQFIMPAALHQDSRYYTLGHGNIAHRAAYAFTRVLITRDDTTGDTIKEDFNYSEVIGAGAASGISSLYYPSQEKTWTKTGQRWLTNVIIDGGTYVFQEFWPDINNSLFHQKD